MPRKYREDTMPVRGDRAGRELFDASVIETEIERRRQQLLTEERRRLIERLRQDPEA